MSWSLIPGKVRSSFYSLPLSCWQGLEADWPLTSSGKVNVWGYTSTPTCFHGVVLN